MIRFVAALLTIFAFTSRADEVAIEVQHLSQAISFQTISHQDPSKMDPVPFNQFLAFVRKTYPRVFAALEVTVIADYSLLMKWQGSNDAIKPVLLDAHYDVVPVEPGTEDDWKFEPFAGEVKDGYVLGRGSIDDKSPAIATFEALERLLAKGFTPERTLYYSLGHDEEIGGLIGAASIAAYLVERGVTFEFMLGEGGIVMNSHPILPNRQVVMVNLAQKGFLTLTLSAEGEGGHSSSPTEDNALVRIAEAVSKLHRNPFEPKLVSPVSDMLTEIGQHAEGIAGWMMRNQWIAEPLLIGQMDSDMVSRSMVRTTTAVTMFNSGVKENVIPQRAEAKVNFRLLPGDTTESLIEDVKNIVDDPRVEISFENWGVIPRVSDMNAPGYRKIVSAVAEVMPEAVVVPGLLIATTDTKHYEEFVDNVYHYQPFFVELEDARGIHGTNERLKADSFMTSIDLMEATLRSIATP